MYLLFQNPIFSSNGLDTLIGYSDESLTSGRVKRADIIHPDDWGRVSENIHSALENRKPFHLEYRITDDTGEEKWLWERGQGVFDSKGECLYIEGFVQDISARKRAEEALRESESRFRTMADHLPLIIWVTDDQGRQDFVNRTYLEFFGISEEQTRGSGWQVLMHPDDADAYTKELYSCVQDRRTFHAETRVRRRDDQWRWVESWGQPRFSETGEFLGHVGTSADITERKRAEDQLRILYNLTLGLASLTDLKDGLRLCVSAAIEATGLDAGGFYLLDSKSRALDFVEHQGLSPEFVESVSRYEADSDHTRLVLSGKPVYARFDEMGLALSEAEKREGLRFLAVIPMGLEGRIIGCLNVASHRVDDISRTSREMLETIALRAVHAIAQLKAQEELRRTNEKLKRVNEEMQEFTFAASHDLQEPLRKIQMFGDLLKNPRGSLSEEQRGDYFVRMQSAAERMRAMIDALLEYSRINTRGQSFTEIDLSETARRAIQILDLKVEETGARVHLADLPEVEADPSQMVQLFQNLIQNALKFHKKDIPPEVKIYSEQEVEGRIKLLVEDNGIGFDEKDLIRIFNPFERLHGKGEFKGTGMGLAICKKIVERHGGTITAKSIAGKGSTFIAELPVKQGRAGHNQPVNSKLIS